MGRPKKTYQYIVCGKKYKGYSRSHTYSDECAKEKMLRWVEGQKELSEKLFADKDK